MKVFISYRREDSSGYTGRLYDSLRARFGDDNVFLDVSGIDSGRKFADVIQGAIHSCDVLLAVIGPEWLTCVANGQRRIDDPRDLVRSEILTALDGGIPVIPVLVGGATPIPSTQLPAPLQPLAALDAHDMTDERWAFDSERLIQAIQKLSGDQTPTAARPAFIVVGVLLLIGLLAGGILLWRGRPISADGASQALPMSALAGEWQADVTYEWGASYVETLSLKVDGKDVFGTASFLGLPRGITSGTLEDGRITFETHTQEVIEGDAPRDVVHRYRGRIDGHSIAFIVQTEGGRSQAPTEFTAIRR